jgi:hypothetical protein
VAVAEVSEEGAWVLETGVVEVVLVQEMAEEVAALALVSVRVVVAGEQEEASGRHIATHQLALFDCRALAAVGTSAE